MSRVGKMPIELPAGVEVTIKEDELEVKGPKGKMKSAVPKGISFKLEGTTLTAERESDRESALHGLARALANNAVVGVTDGFKKQMDVVGVGYKVDLNGKKLVFALGYSHPVEYDLPEGIDAEIERLNSKSSIQQYQATITLSGMDRQKLGQVAAELNRLRKPDAYKGKGIRYSDKVYRLKQGKTAA